MADVCLRQIPAQSDGLAGSFPGAFDPHLIAAEKRVVHGAGVGARGVSERETGVEGDGVLKHLQGELDVLASEAAGVTFAAEIEIVSLEVFGGLVGESFEFLRG